MFTPDESNEEVLGKLFGYASMLTTSQWLDMHSNKIKQPEERLYLTILHQSITDWIKFVSNPTRRSYKNVVSIFQMLEDAQFDFIAQLLWILYKIEEDCFREKFVRWLNLPTLQLNPKYSWLLNTPEVNHVIKVNSKIYKLHINGNGNK